MKVHTVLDFCGTSLPLLAHAVNQPVYLNEIESFLGEYSEIIELHYVG
jgi:hypothetical protein